MERKQVQRELTFFLSTYLLIWQARARDYEVEQKENEKQNTVLGTLIELRRHILEGQECQDLQDTLSWKLWRVTCKTQGKAEFNSE